MRGQKAFETWKNALTQEPNNKALIYKLSQAYKSVGNMEKAKHYEQLHQRKK